jgi:hypothetical protein
MDRLQVSEEQLDGLLVLEPRDVYDKCIVGVVQRFNDRFVLYSKSCIINAIIEGMEPPAEDEDPWLEAIEHFNFNIVGAWVGESTPGFLEDEDV